MNSNDEAKIGKPVGSDEERDKATYPKLFGLEESRRRAHAEVEAALETLQGFDAAAEPLRAATFSTRGWRRSALSRPDQR